MRLINSTLAIFLIVAFIINVAIIINFVIKEIVKIWRSKNIR